ncbi:MAG: beta-ketoacyl synthase N-terminal-like domain-containing protein [Actinomycetota bacterium]
MSEPTDFESAVDDEMSIAVIAMEGLFPGARSVEELWTALLEGRDLVQDIPPEAFLAAGGDPALLADDRLILAEAVVDDIDHYDASYFGDSNADAVATDPQQRQFLQVCHHTLEQAGYDPTRYPGAIGVYAGSGQGDYLARNLGGQPLGPESLERFAAVLGNLVSSMPTRVAFRLGLHGPALAIQTACSSSLVAVHTACIDLLSHRCDMALAGGSSLNPTPNLGHFFVEDAPLARDGRCHAFAADATGIGNGDGVAAVLLKRLADAKADGDRIRAVIRGSAVNNDGKRKVGFTAPSVEGQADVIAEALAVAGLEPGAIGLIEAHGTGTPVGDPIEVLALGRAFGPDLPPGSCALGSVKSNMAHNDTAAGVTGLIKAVLAVERGWIPASLHCEELNPEIDFAATPFRVPTTSERWNGDRPRRAGISSFGIGGTNAHVVIEQPPAPDTVEEPTTATGPTVLTLSAKKPDRLPIMASRLADDLEHQRDRGDAPGIERVAATLHDGRTVHPYRVAIAADDLDDAIDRLRAPVAPGRPARSAAPPLIWVFPGGGANFSGMGRGLDRYPVYREAFAAAVAAARHAGLDLAAAVEADHADLRLSTSLPLTVAVEWALSRLLASWLGAPAAVIGHSLGEYAAGASAGVFTLAEAMTLAAARGEATEHVARHADTVGATLMLGLSGADAAARLPADITVAVHNSPHSCLVSGPEDRVNALAVELEADGVFVRPVPFGGAAHSPLLAPHLGPLTEAAATVEFRTPELPMISTLTGDLLTDELAREPDYWVRQFRLPVDFEGAVAASGERFARPLMIEVGPGRGLSAAIDACGGESVPTLGNERDAVPATRAVAETLGALWAKGAAVDWAVVRGFERFGRVPLPGYPFSQDSHWAYPPERSTMEAAVGGPAVNGRSPNGGAPAALTIIDGLADDHFAATLDQAGPGRALTVTHPVPVAAEAAAVDRIDRLLDTALAENGPVPDPPDHAGAPDAVLDRIAAAHVHRGLLQWADLLIGTNGLTVSELVARAGIVAPYDRMMINLLEMLERVGMAANDSGRWTLAPASSVPDPDALDREVRAEHPDAWPVLDLMTMAGPLLADVLAGERMGAEALSNDDDARAAEQRDSADHVEWEANVIAATARQLAEQASGEGRTLRILEIGSGRGLLTWPVVHALQDFANVEFHVSDIGRTFVLDAKAEAERSGLIDKPITLDFRLLDIEADLGDQVVTVGAYDMVLAIDVLPATNDLDAALRNIRALLAPAGVLASIDLMDLPDHALLTSGLATDLWHWEDAWRDETPMLLPSRLCQALAANGFDRTHHHEPGKQNHPVFGLTLGQTSTSTAARRLRLLADRGADVRVTTAERLAPGSILATIAAPAPLRALPQLDGDRPSVATPTEEAPQTHEALHARRVTSTPYREPETETERKLATILSETLGVAEVGADDDFFELGGESLLALRTASRIRDDLGFQLSARDLFECLTVAALAERLDSMEPAPLDDEQQTASEPPITARAGRGRAAVRNADGSVIPVDTTADGGSA